MATYTQLHPYDYYGIHGAWSSLKDRMVRIGDGSRLCQNTFAHLVRGLVKESP